jgi:hypothetical protein
MTKRRDLREECEDKDRSRDVYEAETSTNNNTTTILRKNLKRDKKDNEVTTAFE